MAAGVAPCDIPHVGDVLIVFRRPASGAGTRQHAATSDRDSSLTDTGGRRRGGESGADHSSRPGRGAAEEVRLLRLRPKVLRPGT
jgi:hypothetical protein